MNIFEARNISIESQIDLPIGLADTGKHNLRRREASLQANFHLAAAHTVTAETCSIHDAEHRGIHIRLHGIMHVKSRITRRFTIDYIKRLLKQFSVVIIERRPDALELFYWKFHQ